MDGRESVGAKERPPFVDNAFPYPLLRGHFLPLLAYAGEGEKEMTRKVREEKREDVLGERGEERRGEEGGRGEVVEEGRGIG